MSETSPNDPSAGRVRAFAVDANAVPLEGIGDVESGNLTWKTLVSGDRTPSNELVFGIANFPPNGCLLPHRHEPAEVYFGISGEGVVTVDGEPLSIRAGVAVYIPGNAEHGTVAGPAGLSIVYGFARGDYRDITYAFRDSPAGVTRRP